MTQKLTGTFWKTTATALLTLALAQAASAQDLGTIEVAALSPATVQAAGPAMPATAQRVAPPLVDDGAVRDYLVGVWESRSEVAGHAITVRVEFRPDGSFSAVSTRRLVNAAAGGEPDEDPMRGQWQARPVTPDRYALTLEVTAPRPQELRSRFRIVDHNTIRDEVTGVVGRRLGG
jgi:hypothetical protein